jgi:anaerobic magnesium-protoporphyrin IX monomethyl ester cyclase
MATFRPDLVIINPGATHGIYGSLGDELVAVEPPLWCRLIAGYVQDHGFTVKIIDAEAERLDPHQITARILHDVPRLICIAVFGHQPSASTQQMYGARLAAQMIRNYAPNIPTIMVGGHVAALPERTLQEEPITFACNGEGLTTIVQLLAGILPYAHIDGLVYWDWPKTVRVNKPAPLVDVKLLHGNVWELLPMQKYRAHNWQRFNDLSKRQPYASIYTSLGCPYACSFCCIQSPFSPEVNGNRYRMRDPADVVAEIKMLHEKYGVETIKIIDELFVLNRKHYTAICQGIIDAGLGDKLNIWCYARVDTVHPENLDLLRRAGVRWLALGIESGSKHVRDGAVKALRNDDIVGVVRQIEAAGIHVISNWIFGLPDDDMESMQATLDLAVELNTAFANFYCAQAYPGSKLYADAVARGAALPATWAGYSQHNAECRPLDTEHVSGAEVLRFRDAAFGKYFSGERYTAMIRERFGADTVAHIERMLSYTLKRKLLETA